MINSYPVIIVRIMSAAAVFLIIAACSAGNVQNHQKMSDTGGTIQSDNLNDNKSEMKKRGAGPALANPAAARCLDDGYTVEPVVRNGVTVDSMCVDPSTGIKCEVWKYFRGECSLKRH